MPRTEMMFSGPVVDFIERFPERANSSLRSEALSTAFLKSSRTSPIGLHLPVSSRSPSHTVSPTKDSQSARELKLTHRDAAVHYAEGNIIKVVASWFLSSPAGCQPQAGGPDPPHSSADGFTSEGATEAGNYFLIFIFTKK